MFGSTSGQSTTSSGSGSLFSSPASTAQPGGGNAIIGVASLSKQQGIHEFAKKSAIKDWLFVFDPSQDRGQLLRGPYDPKAYFGQFNSQGSPGKPITSQTMGTTGQQSGTSGTPATGAPASGTAQPTTSTPDTGSAN
jgi:hypothetical protein